MPCESLFKDRANQEQYVWKTILFLLKHVWLFTLQGTQVCAKGNRNKIGTGDSKRDRQSNRERYR